MTLVKIPWTTRSNAHAASPQTSRRRTNIPIADLDIQWWSIGPNSEGKIVWSSHRAFTLCTDIHVAVQRDFRLIRFSRLVPTHGES